MALLMKARENRLAALDRVARRALCDRTAKVRRPEGPALFISRRQDGGCRQQVLK